MTSGAPSSSMACTGKFSALFRSTHNFPNSSWLLDSGASNHMTPNRSKFVTYFPRNNLPKVFTASGEKLPVAGIGRVPIRGLGHLNNVLHVPQIQAQLFSPQRYVKDTLTILTLSSDGCFVWDKKSNRRIGSIEEREGLLHIENHLPAGMVAGELHQPSDTQLPVVEQVKLFHPRLGHPSFELLGKIFPVFLKNCDLSKLVCDACQYAKHRRTNFNHRSEQLHVPFGLIHSDVWGPSPIVSPKGAKWFIILVDDCTRFAWRYLMKQKSEVTEIVKSFCSLVQIQYNSQVKVFRSDNAKDYFNNNLSTFFAERGIIHESSCVNTPQQNGVAERKIGHVIATTRALLLHRSVPKYLWGEALATSIHLINRLPSKMLEYKSPIDRMSQAFPNMNFRTGLKPRVFGCIVFVHEHDPVDKLSPRAVKCVFVGYSSTQKGYRCYHPPTKRLYISLDVTFQEQDSYFGDSPQTDEWLVDTEIAVQGGDKDNPPTTSRYATPIPTIRLTPEIEEPLIQVQPEEDIRTGDPLGGDLSNLNPPNVTSKTTLSGDIKAAGNSLSNSSTSSEDFNPANATPETNLSGNINAAGKSLSNLSTSSDDLQEGAGWPINLRKGRRACTQNSRYTFSNFVTYERIHPEYRAFLAEIDSEIVPETWSKALRDPKRQQAMNLEMEALEKNRTCE